MPPVMIYISQMSIKSFENIEQVIYLIYIYLERLPYGLGDELGLDKKMSHKLRREGSKKVGLV